MFNWDKDDFTARTFVPESFDGVSKGFSPSVDLESVVRERRGLGRFLRSYPPPLDETALWARWSKSRYV